MATLLRLHNLGTLSAGVHEMPELWDMIPAGSTMHDRLVALENDAIRHGIDLLQIDKLGLVKYVNEKLIAQLEINSFGRVTLVVFGDGGERSAYHVDDHLSDFEMLRNLTETITKEEVGGFVDEYRRPDPNLIGDKIEITLFASQRDNMKALSHWIYGSQSAEPTGHIAKVTAYFDAMQTISFGFRGTKEDLRAIRGRKGNCGEN